MGSQPSLLHVPGQRGGYQYGNGRNPLENFHDSPSAGSARARERDRYTAVRPRRGGNLVGSDGR